MNPCYLFQQLQNYIDPTYLFTAFVLIAARLLLMKDGGEAKVPTSLSHPAPSLAQNRFLKREEPIWFIAGDLLEELSNPSRQQNSGCPSFIRPFSPN